MTVEAFDYDRILSSQWKMNPEPSVRRSTMNSGLPKQIPRFSRALGVNDVTYLMTAEQYQNFQDWWVQTASLGSAWFWFEDPRTGGTVEGRIVSGNYEVTPYTVCFSHFQVSMQVESWL